MTMNKKISQSHTTDKEVTTYVHTEESPPLVDTLWFSLLGTAVAVLIALGVHQYMAVRFQLVTQQAEIDLLENRVNNLTVVLRGIYGQEQFPANGGYDAPGRSQ